MLPAALAGLFVVGLLVSPGQATTYYVSAVGGADQHTCSQAKNAAAPRATITQGAQCLAAGDILEIGAGTYAEFVDLKGVPSGSAAAYTTLRAAPGAVVRVAPTTAPPPGMGSILRTGGGQHHLRITGLTIDGGLMPDVNINGVHTAATDTDATHTLLFEGLQITQTRGDAFILRDASSGITLRKSAIFNIQASGGTNGSPAGGVYVQGTKTGPGLALNIIEHNIFGPIGGGSLSSRSGKDVPIYGLVVRCNLFLGPQRHIYLDEWAVAPFFSQNVFVATGGAGAVRTHSTGAQFVHNTFHDVSAPGIDRYGGGPITALQKAGWRWNIFSHTVQWASEAHKPLLHNFFGNPFFLDDDAAGGYDFLLQPQSPAKGTAEGGKNYGAAHAGGCIAMTPPPMDPWVPPDPGPPWVWGQPPDITVPPPPTLPPIVLPPDPDLPTLPPPVQLPPIVLPPPTQPPPYADGGTTPPLPGTRAPT